MVLMLSIGLAWDSIGATWPPSQDAIGWYSQGFGPEQLEAVQAGFDSWEAAECGRDFEYLGEVDDASYGQIDGRNVVFFLDAAWPEDPALLTAPSVVVQGARIQEADLAFNAQYYAWSTDGDGLSLFDIEGGAAHEVGHLLGLWHSLVPQATLNPLMDGHPEARSLEADDLEGLCSLYQGLGEGGFGDACELNEDCLSGLCLADGRDRYCSEECAGDEDCPDGHVCMSAGDTDVCAVGEPDAECGCSSTPAGLLAALLALGLVRRREKADPPTQ